MSTDHLCRPITGHKFVRSLIDDTLDSARQTRYDLPGLDGPFQPDLTTIETPASPSHVSNILSVTGLVLVKPPRPVLLSFPNTSNSLAESLTVTYLDSPHA